MEIKIYRFVLSCILVTLLFSCESNETVEIQPNVKAILKKHLTIEEFKNSHSNAFNALESFKERNQVNIQSRLDYDENYNFYFNIYQVSLMEFNGTRTYTIPIYRRESIDLIENLAIQELQNGEFEFFIMSYDLNDEDINRIENGMQVSDLISKTTVSGFNGNRTGIHYINGKCYIYTEYDDNGVHVGPHMVEVPCPSGIIENSVPEMPDDGSNAGSLFVNVIVFLNAGNPGGQYGSFPGGAGGGSGSGSGSGYNYPITTTPVINKNEVKFLQQLTEVQSNWWWINDDLENHLDAQNSILDYLEENNYSQESIDFARELIDLSISEPNQEDVNTLVNLTLLIENSGNQFFTEAFESSLIPHTNNQLDLSNDPWAFLTLKTYINYKVLRQINPEWSKAKCIWYASKELIHLSLDAFGLIPVFGELADLTNGALYTIEGDGLNASLSYASAVPFVGWTTATTKFGLRVVNIANDINTKVKLVYKVLPNGSIYFGSNSHCRAQLRKILGLVAGNANKAHHIIPLNLQTNPVIQKAAKSGNAFHINEALNGIPLSHAIHNGSHFNYDNLIKNRLDDFIDEFPNATPDECYDEVVDIINDIRTAIQNNPNTPINQLIF